MEFYGKIFNPKKIIKKHCVVQNSIFLGNVYFFE